MATVNAPLDIYQGDNPVWFLDVRNPDGTPADLSGYTGARAQIRRGDADHNNTIIADLNPIISDNLITINLDTTTTTDLTQGPYSWDLELYTVGPTPTVKTIARGAVNVTLEITRVEA